MELIEMLLRCCGSHRWAEAMASHWPFPDIGTMHLSSDEIWAGLDDADWLEAFNAHPKIGEQSSSAWSRQEQSGAASASPGQMAEIEHLNREYEQRFGYIFIICASGKTVEQFLTALRERLRNPSDVEIRIAAEQQRQITNLRLQKMIDSIG